MLTNEMIKRIHENAVAHGFHEPDSEPTFGEYCALIHEEISEAFSAWRNDEPDEYVGEDGKPEGVWVELADVVIRCADVLATWNYGSESVIVHVDPRHYTIGTFTTLLHSIVSDVWMNGDERSIGRGLNVLVSVVYLFAEYNGIDLDAIVERKCAYNATRPYRHGKRM